MLQNLENILGVKEKELRSGTWSDWLAASNENLELAMNRMLKVPRQLFVSNYRLERKDKPSIVMNINVIPVEIVDEDEDEVEESARAMTPSSKFDIMMLCNDIRIEKRTMFTTSGEQGTFLTESSHVATTVEQMVTAVAIYFEPQAGIDSFEVLNKLSILALQSSAVIHESSDTYVVCIFGIPFGQPTHADQAMEFMRKLQDLLLVEELASAAKASKKFESSVYRAGSTGRGKSMRSATFARHSITKRQSVRKTIKGVRVARTKRNTTKLYQFL